MSPTEKERWRRDAVMAQILDHIVKNLTIKLPPFDPAISRPDDRFALISVGLEPNDFSGTAGQFRYQFEGEEDLLHLIVTRQDGSRVSAEEGQTVAAFLLPDVPPALIWLRPGDYSQHFYVGHDELTRDRQ